MRGMSSVLVDKSAPPDDATLAAALGRAKPQWDHIVARAHIACPGLAGEWKHYGQKHGWQLKLATKKRAIIYLIPHRGSFTAALALNPRAVAALRDGGFAESYVREVENGRTSPEGKPARVEVSDRKDGETVIKLLAVKVASIL